MVIDDPKHVIAKNDYKLKFNEDNIVIDEISVINALMIDPDKKYRFKIRIMSQSRREHNYVTAKHITAKPETDKAINNGGFKDLNNAVAVTSCWLIAYVRH